MNYRRVLPRDLFNEADLLKCYGRLVICLENAQGHDAKFAEEDVDEFTITQDHSSGAITVANLTFMVAGQIVPLYRPLNSRSAWPLWVSTEDLLPTPGAVLADFPVFDVTGHLSRDMLSFIGARP